jgi:hypothetical protein
VAKLFAKLHPRRQRLWLARNRQQDGNPSGGKVGRHDIKHAVVVKINGCQVESLCVAPCFGLSQGALVSPIIHR